MGRISAKVWADGQTCILCNEGGDLLYFCQRCKRIYHLKCYIPRQREEPPSNWPQECLMCTTPEEFQILPNSEKSRAGGKLGERDLKLGCRLLVEMMSSWPMCLTFKTVDTLEFELYKRYIHDPVALDLIKRKLVKKTEDQYDTIGDFLNDVRRMFSNCRTFWAVNAVTLTPSGTIYLRHADKLEKHFDSVLKEVQHLINIDQSKLFPQTVPLSPSGGPKMRPHGLVKTGGPRHKPGPASFRGSPSPPRHPSRRSSYNESFKSKERCSGDCIDVCECDKRPKKRKAEEIVVLDSDSDEGVRSSKRRSRSPDDDERPLKRRSRVTSSQQPGMRQCVHCDAMFDRINKLKNHVLNHVERKVSKRIPSSKPYDCPKCDKEYKEHVLLMEHYAFEHYCTEEELTGKQMKEKKKYASDESDIEITEISSKKGDKEEKRKPGPASRKAKLNSFTKDRSPGLKDIDVEFMSDLKELDEDEMLSSIKGKNSGGKGGGKDMKNLATSKSGTRGKGVRLSEEREEKEDKKRKPGPASKKKTFVEPSSPIKSSRRSRRSSNDKPNYNINSKFSDLDEEIKLLQEEKPTRSKNDISKNKSALSMTKRNKPGPASKKNKKKLNTTVIDLDDEDDDDDIIIDDEVNSYDDVADTHCFNDYDDYPEVICANIGNQNVDESESWKDWIFTSIWESHTKTSKIVEVVSIEEVSIEQEITTAAKSDVCPTNATRDDNPIIHGIDEIDSSDYQRWKEWTFIKIWELHQPTPTIDRIAEPESPTIGPSQISTGGSELQVRSIPRRRNKSTDIDNVNKDQLNKQLDEEVSSFEKEISFSPFDETENNSNLAKTDECDIFAPLTSYGVSYSDGLNCSAPISDKVEKKVTKLTPQTNDEPLRIVKEPLLDDSELIKWKELVFDLIWSHKDFSKMAHTDTVQNAKKKPASVPDSPIISCETSNIDQNESSSGCTKSNATSGDHHKSISVNDGDKKNTLVTKQISPMKEDYGNEAIIFKNENLDDCKQHVFHLIWSRFTENKILGVEESTKSKKRPIEIIDSEDEIPIRRSRRSSINSNFGKGKNEPIKETPITSGKAIKISDSLNNNVSPLKYKNETKPSMNDKPSLRKAGPQSCKNEEAIRRPGPASRRSNRSRA